METGFTARYAATETPSVECPYLSVIVPVYNEIGNLAELEKQLFAVLERLGRSYEVVMIDDGSSDGSTAWLKAAAALRPEMKLVLFRRNYGQTAAMMAGIDHSSGEIIVSIDADLQNDPADIPALLAKLEEGYDVVSGWRRDRKDAAIRRNLVSRWANRLISWISNVHLHDYGCTLKAYRREVVDGTRLYGEMHRFIPIYANWMGAKLVEMPVSHRPRLSGKSKYGLNRIGKVILDLVVVTFLDRFFVKPIYLFGGFGLASLVMSGLCGFLLIYLRLFHNVYMIQTPLPLLAAMTFLVGILSILMGLVAEILVRTYFESQGRAAYRVRSLVNLSGKPG
jgi:glycosyltransferase involved in cell wall biosynthesis